MKGGTKKDGSLILTSRSGFSDIEIEIRGQRGRCTLSTSSILLFGESPSFRSSEFPV